MPARSSPKRPSALEKISVRHVDWPGLVSGALLAAGAIAIYSRTFSVPLILDDKNSITDNVTIRHLWPIWTALSPPNDAGVGGRPLYNLSYALNYAFGGTSVFGYHLVNLIIHMLAAWTLFALVRRTLLRPILAERFGSAATYLALAVGAIWAWHPVQTESVTYVTQRCESLMGLFYLLTLYCFLRGAEADGEGACRTWFVLSVLACLAGVATKEVIITAPLLVLLYDRTFISGSFSGAWQRHWRLYLALVATWLPLGYLMTGLHDRGAGFGQGATWLAYGWTECRVVVKYLLLAIWPHPLVFDYGPFSTVPMGVVWPYALVLVSLLAITAWALLRPQTKPGVFGGQALGFAGAWFFLILAPTSSIVPLVGQPMAEHRLYLPLAGIVALIVLGAFAIGGRRCLPVFALIAVSLGLAAARRNQDYSSEPAIWNDTIAKCPENARAYCNLGTYWLKTPGRLNDAIAQYEEALRLRPDYAEVHDDLGYALEKIPGRLNDAIAQYEETLRLKPDFVEARNNLGEAQSHIPGQLNDAIAQFDEVLRLKPDYAEAHNNLGFALEEKPGRLNDAIAQFNEALRLKPNYAEAHNNMGFVLERMPGRLNDAISQLDEALRIRPDYAEAHNNLAIALAQTPGRLPDAVAQFEEALRLKPDFAEAQFNLAIALTQVPGRLQEAVAHLEEALRLRPDFSDARKILESIKASGGASN